MSYEPTDQPSEVVETPPAGDRSGSGDAPPPVPPPPTGQPPAPPPPRIARRLVRDPYTRLGGVASGLSHHYGVDVSLVRLAFVLFTLVSGFGLLVYILAWIIIPRAEHWPPVGSPQQLRSISSREFATGIIILAGLMALFFSGGTFSQVVVPLVLVAGGVWLLAQPGGDSPPAPPAGSSPGGDALGPVDTLVGSPARPGAGMPVDPPAGTPMGSPVPPLPPRPPAPPVSDLPPGTPVPPRRRRLARVLVPLLFLLVAIPIVAIGVGIALLASGGVEFGSGFSARYLPRSVDEIPATIDHGNGELVVDLTDIDPSAYAGDPVPLAIDMGMGEIRVLLPEGLEADVDADVSAGDIRVFGNHKDGLGVDLSVPADDPDLDLDIKLDFGQITVERVTS